MLLSDSSYSSFKEHLDRSLFILDSAKILLDTSRFIDLQSRLYYSCYHIVRALFFFNDVLNDNKLISNHRFLIGEFNRIFIKNNIFDKSFSGILRDSFARREDADYRMENVFTKEQSIENYNEVKTFVETLKNNIDSGLKNISK